MRHSTQAVVPSFTPMPKHQDPLGEKTEEKSPAEDAMTFGPSSQAPLGSQEKRRMTYEKDSHVGKRIVVICRNTWLGATHRCTDGPCSSRVSLSNRLGQWVHQPYRQVCWALRDWKLQHLQPPRQNGHFEIGPDSNAVRRRRFPSPPDHPTY